LTLKKNSVLDKAYCEVQKSYSAVNVKTIKITNQAEKAQRSRGKQEKIIVIIITNLIAR
jgi:hypothetical protein